MTGKRIAFVLIVAAGLALDLWSKDAAFKALEAARADIVVIDGFFYMHPVRNPGMAWSLFQNVDRRVWVAIRGVLAIVLIGVWWTRPRISWWGNFAFAFVIAGALGNLYDNMLTADGRVRDFILLYFWGRPFPVFNVADSMITVGAPLLLLFFAEKTPRKPAEEKALERSAA